MMKTADVSLSVILLLLTELAEPPTMAIPSNTCVAKISFERISPP